MYVKAINDVVETYPYSIGKLRKDNPNVSFPAHPSESCLASYDVYPVTRTTKPTVTSTQKAVEILPVKTGSEWLQTWEVQDKTQDELDADEANRVNAIYAERDERVNTEINNATPSNKSKDYLLMRSAHINNIRGKGQRPLTQEEQDEENALELMMDEVDRLHTVADDAVANGTALGDITW